MELIQWSEKYSVNNFLIDSQHKKLVSMINLLHDSMRNGKGKETLEKILDDLVKYTKEHFLTEEAMMKKANYPGFVTHKLEHDKLTKKAITLQKSYIEGKAPLTMDILNFLKDWLTNHIEGIDKKYKDKI
jgi:hemerythrin